MYSEIIPATTGEKVASKKVLVMPRICLNISSHKLLGKQNKIGKRQRDQRTERTTMLISCPEALFRILIQLPVLSFTFFRLSATQHRSEWQQKIVLFCTFANFQFAFGCTRKQQCHLHTGSYMRARVCRYMVLYVVIIP